MVWGVLLIGFLAYFLYIVENRVAKFMRHPIATRLQVIDKNPLAFPAVTLCNLNLLRKSYVQNDSLLNEFITALGTHNTSRLHHHDNDTVEQFESRYNIGDVFYEGGHLMEGMFKKCVWQGIEINCSDYITPVSTQLGRCWTFASHSLIKANGELLTSRIGVDGGLQLTLDTQQHEYFFQDGEMAAGFKVLIHSARSWPLIKELGMALSPATDTYISVEEVKVVRFNTANKTCYDTDAPNFVNSLEFVHGYSKEGCIYNCLVDYIINQRGCGCRPWFLHADNIQDCKSDDYRHCVVPARDDYHTNNTILDSCKCMDTCSEIYYRLSQSEAKYPSDLAMSTIVEEQGVNETYYRKNILRLTVYFEALCFESIEEFEEYTVADLQSDIGGNLGLCLGASMMSLAEFGEILGVALVAALKRTWQNNRVR